MIEGMHSHAHGGYKYDSSDGSLLPKFLRMSDQAKIYHEGVLRERSAYMDANIYVLEGDCLGT